MTEITGLTDEQKEKIAEYRKRYWEQAISTKPADQERAETAAKKLAKIAKVKTNNVVWVMSPNAGENVYNTTRSVFSPAYVLIETSLRNIFWTSLKHLFEISLEIPLRESLEISFVDSLWTSLWVSLWTLLKDSLRTSLGTSFRDSSWLAYYSYVVDILNIEISNKNLKLLTLYNELAASCSAVWIAPERIVLCERPKTVKIEDGKLVGLTWRK